jgi:NADH:ubiquinone oxidoreductase subunit 3 (subunit A)
MEQDPKFIGDMLYVVTFTAGGIGLAIAPLLLALFIAARRTRQYVNKADQFIECGMDPIGDAWVRFGAVYYLYALIFVAFAVDVLYLFPVAMVYNLQPGIRDLVELIIFVGVLSLVIVYAWKKRVFQWDRRIYPKR